MPDGDSGHGNFTSLAGYHRSLKPGGPQAAADFRAICTQLRKAGAGRTAGRIEEIDKEIETLSYPEAERRIDPDHVVEELIAAYGRPWWKNEYGGENGFLRWTLNLPCAVRLAHLVRNTFALLPLLLTWGMLGAAALAYKSDLNNNPGDQYKPFLLLWQRGFTYHFWFNWRIPPFGWVAVIDVIILFLVVVFTWWVHRAEGSASQFEDVLYSAMGTLNAVLSQDRISTPTSPAEWSSQAGNVLDHYYARNRTLLDTAKDAIEAGKTAIDEASRRLEGVQGQSETFLTAVHASNQTFLKDFQDGNQAFLTEFQTGNQGFLTDFQAKTAGLIEDFSNVVLGALKDVRAQNEAFIRQTAETNRDAVRQLVEQQMRPLLDQVGVMVAELKTQQAAYTAAVAGLTGSVAEIQGSAAELATSTRDLTGSTRSIADSLATMASSQDRFAFRVEDSAQNMASAATAMTAVQNALRTDLHERLAEMARNVTGASESLQGAQVSLAATTGALRSAATELKDASGYMVSAIMNAEPSARPLRPRRLPWPGRRNDSGGRR